MLTTVNIDISLNIDVRCALSFFLFLWCLLEKGRAQRMSTLRELHSLFFHVLFTAADLLSFDSDI